MDELIESAEAIFERAYEQAAMAGQPRYKSVRAGIQALTEAGRLLPPGVEVSEQWAVRWHLPDGRTDEQDCHGNARETAEQRARRLATHLPLVAVRGEALRRRIHTGPWEVVPDGETAR